MKWAEGSGLIICFVGHVNNFDLYSVWKPLEDFEQGTEMGTRWDLEKVNLTTTIKMDSRMMKGIWGGHSGKLQRW